MIDLFKNPITRLLLFLIVGILYSDKIFEITTAAHLITTLLVTLIFFLIFIVFLYKNYKLRWISGVLSLCFIFVLGALAKYNNSPEIFHSNRFVNTAGIVKEIKRGNSGWSQITFLPLTDSIKNQKWLLTINNKLANNISENNYYNIQGNLQPTLSTKQITSFDYQKYLRQNGYSGQMFISDSSSVTYIKNNQNFKLETFPNHIKKYCENIFEESGLNRTSISIVKALLLGDRTEIDRDINNQFIQSGVVHILAVSGLHVGIIYLIINSVLSLFINHTSHFKWIIAILLLVSYAFVTGFSPSVSRAVLMFSLIQLGQAFKREVNMIQLVILSAFILLLIQPNFIYNAGFWLSHLAVVGIVAFQPIIFKLVKFKFPAWQWAWSIASVSLAAQIGTMPYSLYVFGSFPTYFIVANILILPVVAPLLIFSFLLLVFSFSPFLSAMISGTINDTILYMTSVTKWINTMPSNYLENLWVSMTLAFALYLLLYNIYQLYITTSAKKIVQFLATTIIALSILNIQFIQKTSNNHIIFYETKNGILIDYFYKGTAITIQSDNVNEQDKKLERDNIAKKYMIRQGEIIKLPSTKPKIKKIKLKDESYFLTYNFTSTTYPLIEEKNINGIYMHNLSEESMKNFLATHEPPLIISSDNINKSIIPAVATQLETNTFLHHLKSSGAKVISK